jgi:hypothetical protein
MVAATDCERAGNQSLDGEPVSAVGKTSHSDHRERCRGEDESKPAILNTGIGAGRRRYCEPLAEAIAAKIQVGLSARRLAGSGGAKWFQGFLPIGTTFCSQA